MALTDCRFWSHGHIYGDMGSSKYLQVGTPLENHPWRVGWSQPESMAMLGTLGTLGEAGLAPHRFLTFHMVRKSPGFDLVGLLWDQAAKHGTIGSVWVSEGLKHVETNGADTDMAPGPMNGFKKLGKPSDLWLYIGIEGWSIFIDVPDYGSMCNFESRVRLWICDKTFLMFPSLHVFASLAVIVLPCR